MRQNTFKFHNWVSNERCVFACFWDSVRAVVALNLHSYGSGRNPWGNLKQDYLEKVKQSSFFRHFTNLLINSPSY